MKTLIELLRDFLRVWIKAAIAVAMIGGILFILFLVAMAHIFGLA